MFLRLITVAIFVLFFTSCDFISPKKSTLKNLAIIDTIIDYNTVDVYPLFPNCNNCDSNDKQNLCFEMEFIKSLEKVINENKISINSEVTDTIFTDILIDNIGNVSVGNIHKFDLVNEQIPEFDSILRHSISLLPKTIQPSLKRGIPVNTKFKLPIVVKMKD